MAINNDDLVLTIGRRIRKIPSPIRWALEVQYNQFKVFRVKCQAPEYSALSVQTQGTQHEVFNQTIGVAR